MGDFGSGGILARNPDNGSGLDAMTLAARLIALAPFVHPAISVTPQWAALIADAKKSQQKEAAE